MEKYGKSVDKNRLTEYSETAGLGVSLMADGKRILAGNEKLMNEMDVKFFPSSAEGAHVYVAVDGIFAGCIVISDEIKQDSRTAIYALKAKGVRKTVMLTGDTSENAASVAEELLIDEFYGGLLPGQKVEKVEELIKQKSPKGKLAFVGDGINDAPVLAVSDIGVAMGGLGSDAAIEAADIVLMTDEPSKLAEAVDIARYTKKIIRQNIVFILGVKFLLLFLGALGIATMWAAVFADVGVAVIAVLNSIRILQRVKNLFQIE
jgi:Cd2+/Zn2+-exporting ATPase